MKQLDKLHIAFVKEAFKIKDLTEGDPDRGYLANSILAAIGLKGTSKFSPAARGKRRFYHGSTPENMENMKRTGIWTMGEAHARKKSLTKNLIDLSGDPKVFKESENMAFVGKKGLARNFIAQALAGPAPERHADLLAYQQKVLQNLPKAFLTKPVAVEIPTTAEDLSRIKINPEYTSVVKRFKELGLPKIFNVLNVGAHVLRNTKGIEGGVKPSEIVGGTGYKFISGKGIKAKPLRAVGGLGGVIGSAGLSAYALLDMIKNWKANN